MPRRVDRVERMFAATVTRDGHEDRPVMVDNLSAHGFRMNAVDGLRGDAFFYLAITPDLRIPAQVRWTEEGFAGCEFPRHLTSRQYLHLLKVTGADQSEPQPDGFLARLRQRLGR